MIPASRPPTNRWLKVPLPAIASGGLVWHYTGAEGVLGIVQNRTLWASSPLALNDLSEVGYGVRIILDAWRALSAEPALQQGMEVLGSIEAAELTASIQTNTFVACASLGRNQLGQWERYAGVDGFAVGIDSRARLARGTDPRSMQGWHKVEYNPDQQRVLATSFLRRFAENAVELGSRHPRFCELLACLVLLLKDPAFKDESEVRWIVPVSDAISPRFRPAPGRIVPFVELTALLTDGAGSALPQLVSEVMLGPNARPGMDVVVKRLLETLGMSSTTVSTSGLTYLSTR